MWYFSLDCVSIPVLWRARGGVPHALHWTCCSFETTISYASLSVNWIISQRNFSNKLTDMASYHRAKGGVGRLPPGTLCSEAHKLLLLKWCYYLLPTCFSTCFVQFQQMFLFHITETLLLIATIDFAKTTSKHILSSHSTSLNLYQTSFSHRAKGGVGWLPPRTPEIRNTELLKLLQSCSAIAVVNDLYLWSSFFLSSHSLPYHIPLPPISPSPLPPLSLRINKLLLIVAHCHVMSL